MVLKEEASDSLLPVYQDFQSPQVRKIIFFCCCFTTFNAWKTLKKTELLAQSHPNEFIKMVEKRKSTTEHQYISNLKRTSLWVERKKKLWPEQQWLTDGIGTDFFLFVKISFSSIKSPRSSRKSIKKNLEITKSIL
jgi:hypothetical protein